MSADDLQIYGSGKPSLVNQLQSQLSSCTSDVGSWMAANRLQLNAAKTEVMWCSTSRRQHLLFTAPTQVGSELVAPSSFVSDLGIYLDADVSMRTHVTRTVSGCFSS